MTPAHMRRVSWRELGGGEPFLCLSLYLHFLLIFPFHLFIHPRFILWIIEVKQYFRLAKYTSNSAYTEPGLFILAVCLFAVKCHWSVWHEIRLKKVSNVFVLLCTLTPRLCTCVRGLLRMSLCTCTRSLSRRQLIMLHINQGPGALWRIKAFRLRFFAINFLRMWKRHLTQLGLSNRE